MKLLDFVKIINGSLLTNHHSNIDIDLDINNICYDSRKVLNGNLFIAIKGLKKDGHDFINKAILKGASVVICQKKIKTNNIIPHIKVDNSRKSLAQIACLLANNPSKNLTMVGITGTNGKTTTSYLLKTIIKSAGYKPGIIGSINHHNKLTKNHNSLTTPESPELQNILSTMVKSKMTHVIMEVSSHALDLHRVYGCNFDIAVFTNLTQDHLDYHNNMKEYWNIKLRLFTKHLKKDGIAVVNSDDPKGKILMKTISNTISTGFSNECNIKPISIIHNSKGIKGEIATPLGKVIFKSPLVGNFNLRNILSATGTGIAMNISPKNISEGINETTHVPGRLELLKYSKKISVYIDYAHTPDALKNVIKTLRFLNKGRIITIFGCGGDRDSSKRSQMGAITAKLSDLSIITSDNPRFENPQKISNQIVVGINQISKNYIDPKKLTTIWRKNSYTVILDRQKAIAAGIKAAKTGDTILISGKGHETRQIIRNKTLYFNDKKEAQDVLKKIV